MCVVRVHCLYPLLLFRMRPSRSLSSFLSLPTGCCVNVNLVVSLSSDLPKLPFNKNEKEIHSSASLSTTLCLQYIDFGRCHRLTADAARRLHCDAFVHSSIADGRRYLSKWFSVFIFVHSICRSWCRGTWHTSHITHTQTTLDVGLWIDSYLMICWQICNMGLLAHE